MSENEEQPTSAKERVFGFEEDLSGISMPEELPVLPLRGVVVFPSAIVPLLISRGGSLKVVEHALAGDRMLALVAQRHPGRGAAEADRSLRARHRRPHPQDAQVSRRQRAHSRAGPAPRRHHGVRPDRAVLHAPASASSHDDYEPSPDLEAMQAHMVNQFAKFVSMIPYLPDELQVVAMNIKDPGKVTDLIASNLNVSLEEKQELLATLSTCASASRA